MPQYGKANISIYPGQRAYAFGYPAVPGGPASQTSDQYESVTANEKSAVVSVAAGMGNHGFTQRTINWVLVPNGTFSVTGFILQGAIQDIDNEYVTVDTSQGTGIESRQTNVTGYNFFRVLAPAGLTTIGAIVKIACM